MQAIMYHYVRNFDKLLPNFKFLNVNSFIKQLDMFEAKYGFVTYDEWMNCLAKKTTDGLENKIILTFDDSTNCHFNYVYKVLKEKKLWGIFYIPTLPYKNGEMLTVHKVHLLCAKIKQKELYDYTIKLIDHKMIKTEKRNEFINSTYNHKNSENLINEVKRLLNYYVDENFKNEIISLIWNHFDLKFDSETYYISVKQIKKMSNNGMIFGSHTVNHPVMSKLSFIQQKYEIDQSFSFIDSILKQDLKTYCHPYGGFHSFDKRTVKILKDHNVDFSFNVEPRNITKIDLKNSTQFLPRFDCNQFEYGQVN